MAQRLSPQGYIYGKEPYSEHPFWEQEHADANIVPITITPTNEQQVIEATALVDGYAPITVEAAPQPTEPVIEPLSVTLTNQQQVITAPSGVDGYSPVTIPAAPTPTQPVIQPLSITPSSQQQVITAPSGVDGYSPITVAASQGANLGILVADADLEEKSFIPEPGYDGFSEVLVTSAIPLTMLIESGAITQVYVMTQTSISSAQPLVFNRDGFIGAAQGGAGGQTYEVTYFITATMASSAVSTFENDVRNIWQGAANHVYAYYRTSQTGSITLHTII